MDIGLALVNQRVDAVLWNGVVEKLPTARQHCVRSVVSDCYARDTNYLRPVTGVVSLPAAPLHSLPRMCDLPPSHYHLEHSPSTPRALLELSSNSSSSPLTLQVLPPRKDHAIPAHASEA